MAHVVRIAVVLLALAGPATAQHYAWERTILNPSPSQTAEFGLGIAPRGTDLVIGVPNYIPNDVPGKLGLFDVSGSVIRPYPNPTLDGGDLFGFAVATVGSDVLVGAPGDDAAGIDAGAAYLLDGDTAALLQTFVDPSPSLYFGFAVAGGGGLAYVGDPLSQSVQVYDPGSGTLLGSLVNPAPLEGGSFGRAIAVSATTVAVGAPAGKGAVHLFDAATGAFRRTILNPNPGPFPVFDEQFGHALAWVGDTLLVGNWTDSDETGVQDAGAAYLYDSASGALLHTLVSAAPKDGGYFGYAVGGIGSLALVGALNEAQTGAVTAFDVSTGAHVQTITPPPPGTSQFGQALTSLGDRIVVAAPFDSRLVEGSGAVFLFDPCGNGRQVAGEDCDDGNTLDGDDCPATCRFPGCAPSPRPSCRVPESGGVRLTIGRPGDPARDSVTWRWTRGTEPTTYLDLANPSLGPKGYRVCLYDRTNTPEPRLLGEWRAPAGAVSGWSQRRAGFRYVDKDLQPSGLRLVSLKAARDPLRSKLTVKGKGPFLALPPLPLSGAVVVQLSNDDAGLCWTSSFAAPSRNDATHYVARGD
jgi:cysteine-rich repeat protein